jgi:DNA mismatch endonuclease (patch repair protein)
MRNTPQRDTPCEVALRGELRKRGLKFRVNRPPISSARSKADIVFVPKRLAVFVDGCFWHACPIHGTMPKANRLWWEDKLAGNRRRDLSATRRLRRAGWSVIRVWEHEDPAHAADRVVRALARRAGR